MRVLVLALALAFAAVSPCGEPLERAVFREVNHWRASHALPSLRWNEDAAVQARQHTTAIATGRRPLGHDGFQERIARLGARGRITAAAENIAASKGLRDVAATTVSGWAASAGHRKNMSDNFTEAGVGVAVARDGTVYVTQIYLTSVPRKSAD